MPRETLILANKAIRDKAKLWIDKAELGSRVEFRDSKRTLPQNARMWAMLTDVSRQVTHIGRRYSTDDWKLLFLHALGREMRFIPALDETSFIPVGYRSSDLSKSEMSDLLELIHAFGAEHGVIFHDPETLTEPAAEDASS